MPSFLIPNFFPQSLWSSLGFAPKKPVLMIGNGDTDVDVDEEFVSILYDEFITSVFKMIDKDHNGYITKEELIAAAKNHKTPEIIALQKLLNLPDHVDAKDGSLHALVTIFHTIDKDDSGLIDLEELKAFILKEKSKGMKKKQVDDGDIDALDMFVVIAALGAAAIGAFYFFKARKHI